MGNHMTLLGNLVWIAFGGLIASLAWLFAGILCCITVVGIPFGLQHFKLAQLALLPFGARLR